jgi:hypothetical protein
MFNGKYNFNHLAQEVNIAFGISDERMREIYLKLNAVARLYPSYIIVSEVWLSDDKFTDVEKAFGMMCLGKTFGMAVMMKKLKIKIQYPGTKLPPEGQLLDTMLNAKRDMPIFNRELNKLGNS